MMQIFSVLFWVLEIGGVFSYIIDGEPSLGLLSNRSSHVPTLRREFSRSAINRVYHDLLHGVHSFTYWRRPGGEDAIPKKVRSSVATSSRLVQRNSFQVVERLILDDRSELEAECILVAQEDMEAVSNLELQVETGAALLSDSIVQVPALAAGETFQLRVRLKLPPGWDGCVSLLVCDRASGDVWQMGIPGPRSELLEFHVLSINDFHGRIGSTVHDVSTAYGVRLAAHLEKRRAEFEAANVAGSVLVTAGDNVGASMYESAATGDTPTSKLLNVIGNAASALGNHEFDKGEEYVKETLPGESEFPYLGANVFYVNEDGSVGAPAFDGSVVLTLGTGDASLRVGFLGAVTWDVPFVVSADRVAMFTFEDAAVSMNNLVPSLAEQADVLVAAFHQGAMAGEETTSLDAELRLDTEFASVTLRLDNRVCALITAHTHQRYAWTQLLSSGDVRVVLQSENYAATLGDIKLEVDAQTKELKGLSASNTDLTTGITNEELLAMAQTNAVVLQAWQVVQEAIEQAEVIGGEVIGSVTQPILHPARNIETPLCNVVADAILAGVRDSGFEADFSIQNPGGVRDNLNAPDNSVTRRDVISVLAYANILRVVNLTGSTILELLEQQWQETETLRLCHSDMTYWYSASAPVGSKIDATRVYVQDELLDPERTYRVATNEFLSSGGDRFLAFLDNSGKLSTPITDDTALERFIRANSPVAPDLEERAINADSYRGDEVVLTYEVEAQQLAAGAVFNALIRLTAERTLDFFLVLYQVVNGKPTRIFEGMGDILYDTAANEEIEIFALNLKLVQETAGLPSASLLLVSPLFDENPLAGGVTGIRVLRPQNEYATHATQMRAAYVAALLCLSLISQ